MTGSRPLLDGWSDFSQDNLGSQRSNANDLIQAFDEAGIGSDRLRDFLVERNNPLIEFVDMGQNLLKQKAMVGTNQTGQRFDQLRNLFAQASQCKVCHLLDSCSSFVIEDSHTLTCRALPKAL